MNDLAGKNLHGPYTLSAATDETFDILMGSDVAPRKRFIQTHAKTANLDV
jgi:DNA gyrase/topoisomerase IV subunit B